MPSHLRGAQEKKCLRRFHTSKSIIWPVYACKLLHMCSTFWNELWNWITLSLWLKIDQLNFLQTLEDKILMPCPSMWPKQFWSVQIGFGLTKLLWTWPKWIGHHQNELVGSKLDLWYISFWLKKTIWTRPIHFSRDQFILVVTKSLWSGPNQCGQTKTVLVT